MADQVTSTATVALSVKLDDQMTAGLAQLKTAVDNAAGAITSKTKEAGKAVDELAVDIDSASMISAQAFDSIAEHATSMMAGFVGFEAVKEALKTFIDKADEAAQTQAQLSRATGGHSKELQEQAEVLSQVTRFSADTIEKGQALMANFVGQEDAIKSLTPIVMDLAQAKNMDLSQSFMVVTKALDSTTGVIRGMPYHFEGAAGSAERLASVVKMLSADLGGAAQVAGASGAGSWIEFKNSLDKVEESIGDTMLPYMDSWVEIIRDASKGWQELIAWAQTGSEVVKGDPSLQQKMYQTQLANIDKLATARKELAAIDPQAKDPYNSMQRDELTQEIALTQKQVSLYWQQVAGLNKVAEAQAKSDEKRKSGQKLIKAHVDDSDNGQEQKDAETRAKILAQIDEDAWKDRNAAIQDHDARAKDQEQHTENERTAQYEAAQGHITDLQKHFIDLRAALDTKEDADARTRSAEAANKASDAAKKAADKQLEEDKKNKAASDKAMAELQVQTLPQDKQARAKLDLEYKEKTTQYKDFKEDQVTIDQWYAAEKEKLDDEESKKELALYQARFQAAATFFAGVSQLMTAMAGKNKAMLEIAQQLAVAEAIMNTAVGVTKAYEQGGILGFVTGAGIAAAGAAQVVTIEQQKFASGGIVQGSAPSGDKTPVWANPGEMILNPGQQARLFAIANGNSSTTNTSNHNVTVNVHQHMSPSSAMSSKANARDLARMIKAYMNDPNSGITQAAMI